MKPNRRETISLLASAAPAAIGILSVAGTVNATHAQVANPTGQGGPQKIETRIGTLDFTHDFANGYPTDATIDKLYDERDFQRACQAYLWSLPAVALTSFQHGLTKELGARNGQIVSLLSYEAKRSVLTANATTPYYLGFADLSAGPLVLEMPARGVQGAMNDSLQRAIPGTGAPGKYLVLGPGQNAPDNVDGFIASISAANCFCVPGAGSRGKPGAQAQPTSGSSARCAWIC